MRTLGLDYGDVRIGVAISDPLGWTACGLCVLERKNPIDLSGVVAQIMDIVVNNDVNKIVIGLPKHLNGSHGKGCKKVATFKAKIQKALPDVAIVLFDERLTTNMAMQIFKETCLSRTKIKKKVDAMAAAIILQDYLNMKSRACGHTEGT